MSQPHIRPYRADADRAATDAVRDAVRAHEGESWRPDPVDGYSHVAEADGAIVGYTYRTAWWESDGGRVHLLLGWVAPSWRRRGIGAALLAEQERAARADQVVTGTGTPALGGNADENEPDTRALLLRHGYRVAFTAVELACDPVTVTGDDRLPGGLVIRPVAGDQHPRIHAAIAECFTDSRLGYQPFSYEDYLADLSELDQPDLGLWQVAWDGDEVAGLVISRRHPDGTVSSPWVAVRARWRGAGLATALLRRGLRAMAAAGVPAATIDTVAENPHRTVALYQHVGYRVVRRRPRYRKPMDG